MNQLQFPSRPMPFRPPRLQRQAARVQAAQRQAKSVDAQVQDVEDVEKRRDGCRHCNLEDALDARHNLRESTEGGGAISGERVVGESTRSAQGSWTDWT